MVLGGIDTQSPDVPAILLVFTRNRGFGVVVIDVNATKNESNLRKIHAVETLGKCCYLYLTLDEVLGEGTVGVELLHGGFKPCPGRVNVAVDSPKQSIDVFLFGCDRVINEAIIVSHV